MPSPDQLRALQTQIAPAAVSASRLTGIAPEFLCAQAILESAWLTLLSGRNNCFGIKWYAGAQGRELITTHEWFTGAQLAAFQARGDGRTAKLANPFMQPDARGRKLYVVQDWFATFATLADCFTRHALLFTEGRYAQAARAYRETRDLEAFCRAVGPIYATAPDYADAVLAIARARAVVEICEQIENSVSSFGV